MTKRVWAGCNIEGVTLVVSDGRLIVPGGKTFSVECDPEHRGLVARALMGMAEALMTVPEATTPHSDGMAPSVDWVDDGEWFDTRVTTAVSDTQPAPADPNPEDLEERHS